MKTKHITIRKASGFQISLICSILDTPKGQIRTIEIKDHEVLMADQEPSDTIVLTFNEDSPDTNTSQLLELIDFIKQETNPHKKPSE